MPRHGWRVEPDGDIAITADEMLAVLQADLSRVPHDPAADAGIESRGCHRIDFGCIALERVAEPVDGPDEALADGGFVQRTAHLCNQARERRLRDIHRGP